MEVNILAEKCSVCELEQRKGIHILKLFVCESCEREIVRSEVDDEFYKYYLKKIREINKSLINIS